MNNYIEKYVEIKASPSRAWHALADHQEFGEWFRVKLEGPFVQKKISKGYITYPGYEHIKWETTVQKIEPEQLLSFTWHLYAIDPKKDYSQETLTLVEFKLEKTARGTLLTLTEAGFDKIPSDRRKEAFLMNEKGWTEQLKTIEHHIYQKP